MLDIAVELPIEQIAAICRQYHVRELSVFGSALTDRFGPASDLDFLVVFEPDAEIGFLALARMQRELSELAHRPVDLVPKVGLKSTIRDSVVADARVIYAA
jgi:predicted nucleotidyltransferase